MTGVNYEFILPRSDTTKRDLYHCGDSGITSCYNCNAGPTCSTYCGTASGATSGQCLGGGDEILDTYLYISINGYFNYNDDATGFYTMSWVPFASVNIPAPQLQFLQDLYTQNCMPTQLLIPTFDYTSTVVVNKYWTRNNYMTGQYSCPTHEDGTRQKNVNQAYRFHSTYCTNGTEADSDTVPYCDWMVRSCVASKCCKQARSPCILPP